MNPSRLGIYYVQFVVLGPVRAVYPWLFNTARVNGTYHYLRLWLYVNYAFKSRLTAD